MFTLNNIRKMYIIRNSCFTKYKQTKVNNSFQRIYFSSITFNKPQHSFMILSIKYEDNHVLYKDITYY